MLIAVIDRNIPVLTIPAVWKSRKTVAQRINLVAIFARDAMFLKATPLLTTLYLRKNQVGLDLLGNYDDYDEAANDLPRNLDKTL